MEGQPLSKIKILVLGRFFVGKSSLLRMYKADKTSLPKDEPRRNTIYLDMIYKQETIEGNRFELLIFDLAGQEKFSLTLQSIHRNIRAALVVFSVDEMASFEDIRIWIEQVRQISEEPVIYIIGTVLVWWIDLGLRRGDIRAKISGFLSLK